MTYLEIFCDRCCLPAPINASIAGAQDAQRIRELLPMLRRELLRMGWSRKLSFDLCPNCRDNEPSVSDNRAIINGQEVSLVRKSKAKIEPQAAMPSASSTS